MFLCLLFFVFVRSRLQDASFYCSVLAVFFSLFFFFFELKNWLDVEEAARERKGMMFWLLAAQSGLHVRQWVFSVAPRHFTCNTRDCSEKFVCVSEWDTSRVLFRVLGNQMKNQCKFPFCEELDFEFWYVLCESALVWLWMTVFCSVMMNSWWSLCSHRKVFGKKNKSTDVLAGFLPFSNSVLLFWGWSSVPELRNLDWQQIDCGSCNACSLIVFIGLVKPLENSNAFGWLHSQTENPPEESMVASAKTEGICPLSFAVYGVKNCQPLCRPEKTWKSCMFFRGLSFSWAGVNRKELQRFFLRHCWFWTGQNHPRHLGGRGT